ncbi:hypothetical protein B0H67DRAFT_274847 [Lasiosphaeris hirsuta]|uniref:Uncharacterized protein n=1 Tax=Lasiosphaeris hirsuta TaxID=260670 RepID=A0AA40DRV4_9PEZI|nr:hypothetical protein B0H67DRAFT_274847 [Lasiosphaeris hirsuta]
MQAQRNTSLACRRENAPAPSRSVPPPFPAHPGHISGMYAGGIEMGEGRALFCRSTRKQPDIICVTSSSLSAQCESHGSRYRLSLSYSLPSAPLSRYRKAVYEHDLAQVQAKICVFVEMKGHQRPRGFRRNGHARMRLQAHRASQQGIAGKTRRLAFVGKGAIGGGRQGMRDWDEPRRSPRTLRDGTARQAIDESSLFSDSSLHLRNN